jgi:hypothetical protein
MQSMGGVENDLYTDEEGGSIQVLYVIKNGEQSVKKGVCLGVLNYLVNVGGLICKK